MELSSIIKEAGIVGAGGAGFPSYAKLADGADTLLINGSECEPLLYTDYFILKTAFDEVVEGIKIVKDFLKVENALLCIKQHTADKLSLGEGEVLDFGISVKVLPNVYPMGDEISMIYEALGRVVKPGNLPITAGVIVYNVETVYNVFKAVKYGNSVVEKYVMIGGNVQNPIVAKVPVGTPVISLFNKYGITVDENSTVLDGGPSMGKIINIYKAVVTKTTKSLLVLPNSTTAIACKKINAKTSIARAETACCQCMRCTDLCPRGLLGYPLEPHKMVRTAAHAVSIIPDMVLAATLCCGCGICEALACCQGISPRAVISEYKALLAKNKKRFVGTKEIEAKVERNYRMIPSDRWSSVLGVLKYDKMPKFVGEDFNYDKVEILLSQHIGAPSVPIVKNGDIVKKGQKIAESASGLSLPQYASIDGVVSVQENKIIITKVN